MFCDLFVCILQLNVNQQDNKGDTPGHDAARFGFRPIVEALLKAGLDKKVTNKEGKTASQVAADFDHPEIAKLLA